MCGADDGGDEVEEEGNYDSDVVDFKEKSFASESFWGLLWVVVEHLDASAWWISIVIPVDLFFAL